jgi:hypothetical protein
MMCQFTSIINNNTSNSHSVHVPIRIIDWQRIPDIFVKYAVDSRDWTEMSTVVYINRLSVTLNLIDVDAVTRV